MSEAIDRLRKKYRVYIYVFMAVWAIVPICVFLMEGVLVIHCCAAAAISLLSYFTGLGLMARYIEARCRIADAEAVYGGQIIR